ncbi:MT-A70-domain-containing protein [Amylocystis lapponica]|nr:MT-A70-domain-containing protein [Amylocystis lapponica]
MSVSACLASANDLLAAHAALVSRVRTSQLSHRSQLQQLPSPPQDILKLPLIPPPPRPPTPSPPSSPVLPPKPRPHRPDLPPAKRARVARYGNYVPEEETIRNDYSQRYVDGGEWPQNWVLGADPEHRFEESVLHCLLPVSLTHLRPTRRYPKQQRLLTLKKISVAEHALPPTWLPFSELASLHPAKFDVILIDPPFSSSFTWDDLQELPVPALAADPSFVLLWVGSGSGDGLERGREVLAKWGFRRCEDIVWAKSNATTNRGPGTDPPTTSLLTRTKQHCLMGIRGTVRRSTDSWFVHCNVDTDVMLWEGDPTDPTRKPPETYTLIENFCLGLRRLELFARARSARRGWVSALADGEPPPPAPAQHWAREAWEARVRDLAPGARAVVPMTPEIDALRPKSPMRGGPANAGGNAGAQPAQTGGQRGFAPPRMMAPQMMGDAGMMAWPEMGMGMGMPMGMSMGMGMGGFGQGGAGYGMGMGNMGANMGGNMGGNMGWERQFGDGMWDGMGEGVMGMGGMGNMQGNMQGNMGMGGNMGMSGRNMNMNPGMNPGMNPNMGMGMGMGQWRGDGFEGNY